MALFHYFRLRDVVHLLLLVDHALLVVQVLCEALFVLHSPLAVQKQAVVNVHEFRLGD